MPVESPTPIPRFRTSMRLGTSGLALVFVLLTVFAVTVAVTNRNGTERAARATAESDLYEKASEALVRQEQNADDFVTEGDEESRREYVAADRATRDALEDLHQLTPAPSGAREAERLLAQHARYRAAVQAMFEVARRDPDRAEAYEDTYVDRHFDPLASTLAEQVTARYNEARAALASIERTQQLLVVATPSVFGVGLVLLTMFMIMLARSRRLVGEQADRNRHQSLHDALTGLPNRTLLHQHGTGCIEQSATTGTPMALMLLDLDRFKEINDTLGHHHGDVVLQEVSERLRRAVRPTDIVARLGGDEFAILLPQVQDTAEALRVAAQVQDALGTSVDTGGVLLDVGMSMGLAISGVHGNDMDGLLQHADIAMYHAKEHDLGVAVYDDELNEYNREQLGLLGQLRRAIENDELVLHYQPKIAMPSGEFFGAEALVRWQHPTRGLIPPGLFIPAAEHTALIRPLTSWVLNAALAECKRWYDAGQSLQLAVNVSARNLLEASFADDVLRLLSRWELPSSCLVLEVTESAIMVDPVRAQTVLQRLAQRGIGVAVDDFGAGYTSLGHLRTLPVQELKIDQSMVKQMATSAADALILKAIIDLAHSLGLRTVAEGVEDADTLDRLGVLGCDVAQGFHIARPMPAAALSRWRAGLLVSAGHRSTGAAGV